MVVVSHLFLFYGNNLGRHATGTSHMPPCLKLPVNRQPLFKSYIFAATIVLSKYFDTQNHELLVNLLCRNHCT